MVCPIPFSFSTVSKTGTYKSLFDQLIRNKQLSFLLIRLLVDQFRDPSCFCHLLKFQRYLFHFFITSHIHDCVSFIMTWFFFNSSLDLLLLFRGLSPQSDIRLSLLRKDSSPLVPMICGQMSRFHHHR